MLADPRHALAEGADVQRTPEGRREDEAAVGPPIAGNEPLGSLCGPVAAQEPHDGIGEVERPAAAARLQVGHHELAPAPQQLPADVDDGNLPVDVDIGPRQSEHLATTETESQGDDVGGFETMAFDGGQERPSLLGCEASALTAGDPRAVGDGGDVADQQALLLGPAPTPAAARLGPCVGSPERNPCARGRRAWRSRPTGSTSSAGPGPRQGSGGCGRCCRRRPRSAGSRCRGAWFRRGQCVFLRGAHIQM